LLKNNDFISKQLKTFKRYNTCTHTILASILKLAPLIFFLHLLERTFGKNGAVVKGWMPFLSPTPSLSKH